MRHALACMSKSDSLARTSVNGVAEVAAMPRTSRMAGDTLSKTGDGPGVPGWEYSCSIFVLLGAIFRYNMLDMRKVIPHDEISEIASERKGLEWNLRRLADVRWLCIHWMCNYV